MLSRLSSFLRYTLVNEPAGKVTVMQEVETLKLYLEIEKMRFEDRLRTHFHIDPVAVRAHMPSLLLQPLVENAIKYAVTPQEEGADISVDARKVGDRLLLTVSDTGPGADGFGYGTGQPSTGVGLANIRDRLAQAYGGAHAFQTRQNEHGGFSVILDIPFEGRASVEDRGRDAQDGIKESE
jgi:LytS/YehU family sensor histidine kinase